MFLTAASQCELFSFYNSLISANFSSFKKLVEALAVLLKSTAHTLCILNAHQSHCCQKYIKLCEQQHIEKIKLKISADSEEEYKTVID